MPSLEANFSLPADSQEIFPDETVAQAIRNVSEAVGAGVLDEVNPNKLVLEASYRVLDRKYGKPRETLELSHNVKLRIDIPDWNPKDIYERVENSRIHGINAPVSEAN